MPHVLTVLQISRELGRGVGIAGSPRLVVDDGRLVPETPVDVSDEPVQGGKLLFGVIPLSADVDHLDAYRPGVHGVIRRPVADGHGSDHFVAAVFYDAVSVVVARVPETRMMGYPVERHALDDGPVLADDEVDATQLPLFSHESIIEYGDASTSVSCNTM